MTVRWMIAIATLVVACGGEDEAAVDPAHGRGPRSTAASVPIAEVPSTPVRPTARRRRSEDSFERDPLMPAGPLAPITIEERTEIPGTPAREAERDLPAELSAAIGSPASCIDLPTARSLHGRLSIHVSAHVMPTGSVSRAEVSASLPATTLQCVEQRALHAHLATPIEGAPLTVSTTLVFDVSSTADQSETITPAWRQPGDVAEPGVVLPAVGAEGRPEGSVAPDVTQPAIGAQGRPEGSVAPDIVLPARGR